MQQEQPLGKIILINGASSSGKSTLSRLLQQNLTEPFIHFSYDHLRDSKAIPIERFRNGDFDWSITRPSVFDGFHRCLAALAEAGNNLIVDHIIENWMQDLVQLLARFDVYFVGVHCPLKILEQREIERGDRRIGEAKMDFETVHKLSEYDLEIDSTLSNIENVNTLINAWQKRLKPCVFDKVKKRDQKIPVET